jgi:hypothetical protein
MLPTIVVSSYYLIANNYLTVVFAASLSFTIYAGSSYGCINATLVGSPPSGYCITAYDAKFVHEGALTIPSETVAAGLIAYGDDGLINTIKYQTLGVNTVTTSSSDGSTEYVNYQCVQGFHI